MKYIFFLICLVLYTSCKTLDEVKVEDKNYIHKTPSLEIIEPDTLSSPILVLTEGKEKFENEVNLSTNENATTMSNTVIITGIIIPLFVLIFGLIYNWYREKRNKVKENEDFRNIIFYWVEENNDIIKDQYRKIEEFANTVKISNDILHEGLQYTAKTLYKLKDIPLEKYVSIFVLNSTHHLQNTSTNETILYGFINNLEFLIEVENEVKKRYEEYRAAYKKTLQNTNQSYLDLNEIIKKMDLESNRLSPPEIRILVISKRAIENYIQKYNKGSVNAKIIIYDILVKPISDCISSLEPEDRTHYIDYIGKIISDYYLYKRQWDRNQEEFGDIFSRYAKSYKTVLDNINEKCKFFKEKTKVKSFFRI